jgi:tetratricopeptide (TPR) repeat protein
MKTMNLSRAALTFLALAWPAGPALAAYEDVGVGARATGLGGALTGAADDVYAIYHNPAGLATIDRPELGTTYSRLLTGLSDNSNLQNSFIGYAHPLQGGRKGVVGGAWNYYTLDGLYRETSLYGSYGRALWARDNPGKYFGGASVKVLTRSLGGTSAAGSAISNTGIATGTPDPVLQNASKTNFDVDLGFIYRVKPRWQLGAAVQHLLEPNVGFSAEDKLGRNLKLGGAYKTPFTTLSGDVRLMRAPDGSTDKIFAAAAEKWLPTLLHGTFGVRGSLAMGSRDYRQLAMGLSYKINRLQFDYGFALPLGGFTSTSGSHRVGLTVRFGRPRQAEAALGEAILENLRDLAAVGTPEFRYQLEDLALYKRTAIDEFLRQAKLDASNGRFQDADDKLGQALSLKPGDRTLVESHSRMGALAKVVPVVKDFGVDAAQAALYEGALDFIGGRDKDALRKVAYAESLNPADERLEPLMRLIEEKAGLKREDSLPVEQAAKAPTLGAEKVVGGTMALMEVALREKDYNRVMTLAEQVLQLDPNNALAYKRLGAAHYAERRLPEALKALRSAYKLERDPEQRKQLKAYVDALAALVERRAVEAAPRPAEPAPRSSASPQDIERLYEAGVDLYAQGRLSEAAAAFKRILELEPDNVSARRALDRVSSEILQGGKK